METVLTQLNQYANNKADETLEEYAQKTLEHFKDNILGVEMGSAYGGNVEMIARTWGDKGKIWGFDTFEGHPKHLSQTKDDDLEKTCMDVWYRDKNLGENKLKLEYQQQILKENNITNAYLVKGEVNQFSCDHLPYINFAFLDMDILESMQEGYRAVAPRMTEGGYLILHDVLGHIPRLADWYEHDIKPNYEVVYEAVDRYVAVLRT